MDSDRFMLHRPPDRDQTIPGESLSHDQRIVVIQDTREQDPWFFSPKEFVIVKAKLDEGDYSIRGFEKRITIERKWPNDFLTCCGSQRDRFKRELERMKNYDYAEVIVEGIPRADMSEGEYRSLISPHSVYATIASISMNYKVMTYIFDTRAEAQSWAAKIFHLWIRRILKGLGKPGDLGIAQELSLVKPGAVS